MIQVSENSGYLPWTFNIWSQKKGSVRQRPVWAICGAHLLLRGYNVIALDREDFTRRSTEVPIF